MMMSSTQQVSSKYDTHTNTFTYAQSIPFLDLRKGKIRAQLVEVEKLKESEIQFPDRAGPSYDPSVRLCPCSRSSSFHAVSFVRSTYLRVHLGSTRRLSAIKGRQLRLSRLRSSFPSFVLFTGHKIEKDFFGSRHFCPRYFINSQNLLQNFMINKQ